MARRAARDVKTIRSPGPLTSRGRRGTLPPLSLKGVTSSSGHLPEIVRVGRAGRKKNEVVVQEHGADKPNDTASSPARVRSASSPTVLRRQRRSTHRRQGASARVPARPPDPALYAEIDEGAERRRAIRGKSSPGELLGVLPQRRWRRRARTTASPPRGEDRGTEVIVNAWTPGRRAGGRSLRGRVRGGGEGRGNVA